MNFKNELKYSKRSDHVIDDAITLEWMNFLPTKTKQVTIVERWQLEEVRLYIIKMRVVGRCYIQGQLNSRLMYGNPRESRILDSKLWIPDSSYWIPHCIWRDFGFFEPNPGFQSPGSRIPQLKRKAFRFLESRLPYWETAHLPIP